MQVECLACGQQVANSIKDSSDPTSPLPMSTDCGREVGAHGPAWGHRMSRSLEQMQRPQWLHPLGTEGTAGGCGGEDWLWLGGQVEQ